MRRRCHQQQADEKDNKGDLADIARRQKRGRDQHHEGGDEEQDLPVDEVEGIKADAGGDRRAGGKAQHDAAEHQRPERREGQAVDRAPPFAQRCPLGTRGHVVPETSPALVRWI